MADHENSVTAGRRGGLLQIGSQRRSCLMAMIRKILKLAADIYEDRKLLKDLSLKDVKRRFSGTYFGMVWGVLQPLSLIHI